MALLCSAHLPGVHLSLSSHNRPPALPCPPCRACTSGIYLHAYDTGLNVKNGFPVFSTVLEANQVKKREDAASMQSLSDEDKVAIHELAKDPRIGECGSSTLMCLLAGWVGQFPYAG